MVKRVCNVFMRFDTDNEFDEWTNGVAHIALAWRRAVKNCFRPVQHALWSQKLVLGNLAEKFRFYPIRCSTLSTEQSKNRRRIYYAHAAVERTKSKSKLIKQVYVNPGQ